MEAILSGGLDYPFFSLNNTKAGFAYVDAAYGVVCLVVFCSLLLAPPQRRPLRHSMAQTAKALPSRFLAINAPPGANPKGCLSNMQIAHAGIVFLITGVLLSNTQKQQWTTVLPYGSERLLGNQICCLRGIDHHYGPTFHAICGNLVVYQQLTGPSGAAITLFRPPGEMLGFKTSYGSVQTGVTTAFARATVNLAQHWVSFVVRQTRLPWSEAYSSQAPQALGLTTGLFTTKRSWATNSFCAAEWKAAYFCLKAKPPASQWPRQLCMFPETRFGLANQQFSTTKVAIHTNLLTDFYGLLGAGSAENGWSTSIMKLPFMFCIWIGFVFAALGAVYSISNQLHRTPVLWY